MPSITYTDGRYEISAPFDIGPRLMPSLTIADGRVSLAVDRMVTEDGAPRVYYRYAIDGPDGLTHEAADISTPWVDVVGAFAALLSFLEAAAEAYSSGMFYGKLAENIDLFPDAVMEWAYQNADDIGIARYDIDPELSGD